MKRKAYGRDAGLTLRMLFTGSLLGLLYVFFALALFYVLNAGLVLMLVIVGGLAFVQYFTSDKLALRASGAKVVERDEAPALHDMIERLAGMADLPKPRVAIIESEVPNAFADRPEQEARGRGRHDRALEPARATGDRGRARARALPHRQPRRPRDDRGELLRDARRPADPLRALLRDVRRLRREPRQQQQFRARSG